MKKTIKIFYTLLIIFNISVYAHAQTTLTLEQCREMTIKNNKDLQIDSFRVEMAKQDKNIAIANYFPNINVTGSYTYNQRNINLINDKDSKRLRTVGTQVQGIAQKQLEQFITAVKSSPRALQEFMSSALWQQVVGTLSQADFSKVLNNVGEEIDNSLHLNVHNVFLGVISIQQPLFMGGKIIASNKMANLATQLSESQYNQKYENELVNTDLAYWQVVSISNKLKIAEAYYDLLNKLMNDVNISCKAGVMTQSDLLQIKVKVNEAQMMKNKAINGLALSKMLLCKQIGLPLDSKINLADEDIDNKLNCKEQEALSLDEIYENRPEIKSLSLASKIFEQKIKIARSEMMPKIFLTANYFISNPNPYYGFQNKFGTSFNAGVAINIPIFHGLEALHKTKKAKIEAEIYKTQLNNAKDLINLQVNQLRQQEKEDIDKISLCQESLQSAEENLRVASVGFEEGTINTNTALAAHTAWLQAKAELLEAKIQLQINRSKLLQAQGLYLNK